MAEKLNMDDLSLGSNLDLDAQVKPKLKAKATVQIEEPAPAQEPVSAPPIAPPIAPAVVSMPQTHRIIIEENDNIPPTGLYVGLNGRGYLIRPGEEVTVPHGVKEILDNAIETVPQIDPTTRRVVGYRERTRYPYRNVG